MRAIDAGYVRSVLPRRRVDASKQDCGRALLLCGSARYLGAPYFAAHIENPPTLQKQSRTVRPLT